MNYTHGPFIYKPSILLPGESISNENYCSKINSNAFLPNCYIVDGLCGLASQNLLYHDQFNSSFQNYMPSNESKFNTYNETWAFDSRDCIASSSLFASQFGNLSSQLNITTANENTNYFQYTPNLSYVDPFLEPFKKSDDDLAHEGNHVGFQCCYPPSEIVTDKSSEFMSTQLPGAVELVSLIPPQQDHQNGQLKTNNAKSKKFKKRTYRKKSFLLENLINSLIMEKSDNTLKEKTALIDENGNCSSIKGIKCPLGLCSKEFKFHEINHHLKMHIAVKPFK